MKQTRRWSGRTIPFLFLAALPVVGLSPVQGQDTVGDFGIGLGAAHVVAQVIVPGGDVIAFDPLVGMFQIAQQHPLAGTITAADAAAFGHHLQKFGDVLGVDPVVDHHHDRAGAAPEVELQRGFAEAVAWLRVAVPGFVGNK